jgi:cysteine desulfurase/selenocysteine lyase
MKIETNILESKEEAVFTEHEIGLFRNDTNGTRKKIHFNNSGASLPPNSVVNAVMDYLHDEALIGGYEMEDSRKEQIENTYHLIAKLINADPSEIAITENAGMAWGLAFNGIDFKEGDEIVTSEMEYVTNLLAFTDVKQNKGVQVKVIPNDENGNFLFSEFERVINPKTKLIAITHIASSNGGMMPINAIGRVARKHGILYLVDACQSAGHLPVDVKQIGCDMLSVTGRKYLRAPRGTGFLYIRKEIQNQIKPFFIDWHSIQSITLTIFS